ncbi:hypothetical protein ACIA49_03540 [Kribbella sp. NPDC051587]|uniref:hypothetical protein n=1 Tax=Kribbella sp. NPDC051587 TaxID=3364119 RepID=UPI0037BD1312
MSREEFAARRVAGLAVRNERRLARAVETSAVSLLVQYLRRNGFSCAERRPSASNRHLDAVAGTPGVQWSVRSSRSPSGAAGEGQIASWLQAAIAHQTQSDTDVVVMVAAVPASAACEVARWRAIAAHRSGRRQGLLVADVAPLLVSMGYGGCAWPDGPLGSQ